MVASTVPEARQGTILGVKQSGVQLGAFVAGFPLAGLASSTNWRACLGTLALTCLVFAAGTWQILPGVQIARSPVRPTERRFPPIVAWLTAYSVALGVGSVALNTYLSVYAAKRFALPHATAGTLVGILGVTGVVGRIGWTRLAGQRAASVRLLPLLAMGAGLAPALLLAAPVIRVETLWVAAVAAGLFGIAANAVSMLTVVRSLPSEQAGAGSARVAAGYFGGFALGPLVLGPLAEISYAWLWTAVIATFALAAGLATITVTRRSVNTEEYESGQRLT